MCLTHVESVNFLFIDMLKATVDTKDDYILDRNAAARSLKVSVRTLDRYLKGGKLKFVKEDGKIWLSKSELSNLKYSREERVARRIIDRVSHELSVENVDSFVDSSKSALSQHVHLNEMPAVESIYKALYEEAKHQLEEQQKRLEGANYRVGQLEAELKNTVPMMEFQQKQVYYLESSEDMKQRLEKVTQKFQESQKQYQLEKYNKSIYLVILFAILALQPLWLILVGKF